MTTATTKSRTVHALLDAGRDEATAITTSGAKPLTYAGFRALVERTVKTLNELGIGLGDRVAIVLPNGPEIATAFVAIASGATAAPLNPGYRADEFEFYMADIAAKALVVEEGSTSPAVAVAEKRRIPIVTLRPDSENGAGAFVLSGRPAASQPERTGIAESFETALILHTSGTTSRPKIVPLSHSNVGASASNIATSLALSEDDRALNILPLFHIHGLIAGVLAPLSRGGSIFCTPGFNALKFFSMMEEATPTWYTAVPTMHQAIVSRARRSQPRDDRALSAAVHSLIVIGAAASGHHRARNRIRRARDRGVRNDRSRSPNGLEPYRRRAQTGNRRPRRRAGGRDHGSGRQYSRRGPGGRDRYPWRQRHGGIREQSEGQ